MIRLFGQTDTIFNNNGDVILRPLKAKVHKEDNGAFYLDFECGLEYVQYMNEGNIIVVDLPQGAQAFRITNPQKTRSRIIVKAYHVFYDSKNYLIVDSYVQDKTCQQALTHLSEATEPTNPFSVVSDINTLNSYRCVRKSWHDAIFTVLERWGGHLVRDNFSIAIRQTIGSDNGVVIRYAKNLKEISSQEDWTDVVTKLLPVGRDGILLNALDPFADIYLEASVSYPLPFTKSVNFEQSINENDYADSEGVIDEQAYKQALVDDLRAQATEYINENCVPKVNYTLKANIENITDVGDSIEVIDEKLGIDISTNVISFDYDCILGKYTELEFGNFKPKLSNLMGNISTQIRQVEDVAMQSADAIISTLSDSYVAYYHELNVHTRDDSKLVYDAYYSFEEDGDVIVPTNPDPNADYTISERFSFLYTDNILLTRLPQHTHYDFTGWKVKIKIDAITSIIIQTKEMIILPNEKPPPLSP